jgi:hypothetical protein
MVIYGREAYRPHSARLKRGRTGEGRMVLSDQDLSGERIGPKALTAARFVSCKLDRADLARARRDIAAELGS